MGGDLANLYQIGDSLGKGAFGAVYRGLNIETGECVAIKKVNIGNIPKSQLASITIEIDLLKKLKHSNIVKYLGSYSTKEHLHIVLEFCESGSLQAICKKFGKIPESLVSVYVNQVLSGLAYLHEQGVIHRDIKGANILTTKDGLVKLADFGVATKLGDKDEDMVVGSPYWMAPEVIELNGASSASDIWSLGCTVVELLQGKPPYHELAPMQALFRIVQDEHPPIPEGISPALKDFLMQCFQKDVNLRVNAKKLTKHPWITNNQKKASVIQEVLPAPAVVKPALAQAVIQKAKDFKSFSESNSENWSADFGSHDLVINKHTAMTTTASSLWDKNDNTVQASTKLLSKPSKEADAIKVSLVQTDLYKEDAEDEDFSAAFGNLTIHSSLTRPKSNQDLNEDDDDDPFASIEKALELTNMDENFQEKDKLLADIGAVFSLIKLQLSDANEKEIAHSLSWLLKKLEEGPDIRSLCFKNFTLFPLIELLESNRNEEIIKITLQIFIISVPENLSLQESISITGGIATLIKFISSSLSADVRCLISKFFNVTCRQNNICLQTFIACRGLSALVDFISIGFDSRKDIAFMAISTIDRILELLNLNARSDCSRLLLKRGLHTLLASVFSLINADQSPEARSCVFHILQIYSVFSNIEIAARELVATRQVVKALLSEMRHLSIADTLTVLKIIRNFSVNADVLQILENAGVIEEFVYILSHRHGPRLVESHNHTLSTLYNLCKIEKRRQERAAQAGVIPSLQYIFQINSPMKEFALPILLDMAHAGQCCRKYLWETKSLEFFVQLIKDQYWQINAVEAIYSWLSEEAKEVEKILVLPDNLAIIIDFLTHAPLIERTLEPIKRVVSISPLLQKTIGIQPVIMRLLEGLAVSKAVVRLNCLKILALIVESSDDSRSLGKQYNLKYSVERIANDDQAILVQEMANQLLQKIKY